MDSQEALSRFEARTIDSLTRAMNSDEEARRQWERVIAPAIQNNRVALIGEMEGLGSEPTLYDGNPDRWFDFAEIAPVVQRSGLTWYEAQSYAAERNANVLSEDLYRFLLNQGVSLDNDGASSWVLGNGLIARSVGMSAFPFGSDSATQFAVGGDRSNRVRLSFRVERLK